MGKKEKFEYAERGTDSIINSYVKEAAEDAQKYELEKKQEKFDKSLVDLENKMVEFAIEYGKNDFRTELLVTLYDVCIEMKSAIALMSGVMVALDCINQTISFMDECLNFNQMVEENSLTHNYGLIYRIKAAIRRRRVNRNMQNRIRALNQRINDIVGLSNTMVESLRVSMTRMQMRMKKQNMKREKKFAKKGIDNPVFEKTKATDILEKRLAEQNANVEETSGDSTAPAASTPTAPAGKSSDSPNIDDIV